MSTGGLILAITIAGSFVVLAFLVFSMVRSIADKRTEGRSVWREFGLTIILLVLFLTTWLGQGVAQWQTFTDEERAHGEEPEVGDFLSEFSQSTLENWQSEFLQLFSFVALAALYIHKGSSESKDSEEKIEAPSSASRSTSARSRGAPPAPTSTGSSRRPRSRSRTPRAPSSRRAADRAARPTLGA